MEQNTILTTLETMIWRIPRMMEQHGLLKSLMMGKVNLRTMMDIQEWEDGQIW